MTERLLHKYAHSREPVAGKNTAGAPVDEGPENLGICGLLRGLHERAVMLELRHKDGRVSAFSYTYLQHAEFDPSEGITLQFAGKSISISGRNLGSLLRPNLSLFGAIIRHRAAWIVEVDEATAMAAPPETVLVDELRIDE